MTSKHIATALAALDRAARPRVAGEAVPSLFAVPPVAALDAGGRHVEASSRSTAAAAEDDDFIDKLNAERGLHAGANPGGARFVPGAIAASRDGDDLSSTATAAAINAAHAHLPGFVMPEAGSGRRASR